MSEESPRSPINHRSSMEFRTHCYFDIMRGIWTYVGENLSIGIYQDSSPVCARYPARYVNRLSLELAAGMSVA